MTHRILSEALAGELPPVIVMERRRTPSRRAAWRGGRRDSDWVNRPPDSLARLAKSHESLLARFVAPFSREA